jgi:hypothetical protein
MQASCPPKHNAAQPRSSVVLRGNPQVYRAIGFEDQQQLSDLISQYSYAWDANDTDTLLALFCA